MGVDVDVDNWMWVGIGSKWNRCSTHHLQVLLWALLSSLSACRSWTQEVKDAVVGVWEQWLWQSLDVSRHSWWIEQMYWYLFGTCKSYCMHCHWAACRWSSMWDGQVCGGRCVRSVLVNKCNNTYQMWHEFNVAAHDMYKLQNNKQLVDGK